MTINCLGDLIELTNPKILGIVNLTPDSFYDSGSLKNEAAIISKVEKMLQDGADFIDVGGYSSRPGATDISIDEEMNRVLPVVKLLVKEFSGIRLSIDTFRSSVAKACLDQGAALINDISAGNLDAEMLKTIAAYQVPYIMMHMKGSPQTMQSLASYKNITQEVCFYFSEKIAEARALGIHDIIVDPGFGFAKTLDHNFELLTNFEILKQLDVPILAGISRKSMIYKTLNTTADQALNGTTALHMIALQKGANILRVHDVKEAKECVVLFEAIAKFDNTKPK
ncbi:dihydropteroate synthase [Aquimarina agarivorans]|uniref:dihydropteroate synthase n=1 Tax=Aquimarina agarivorans TaxID=980584 RepID=UPI000248E776|nr:dihydropteroate synthase [Aquimarina agarivorans]